MNKMFVWIFVSVITEILLRFDKQEFVLGFRMTFEPISPMMKRFEVRVWETTGR